MSNGEKIFLAVAAVALVAVVLWRNGNPFATADVVSKPNEVDDSQTAANATGPAWLVYNQPWGFNAALGNPMPSRSNGQVGQVTPAGAYENFSYNDCGCA